MTLLDLTVLAAGVAATALLLAAAVFFTRATLRRMGGALIAAIRLIPLVARYDAIAARFGWWWYPTVTGGSAPLAWYVAAALFYGAALGLTGWRVIRRSGQLGKYWLAGPPSSDPLARRANARAGQAR